MSRASDSLGGVSRGRGFVMSDRGDYRELASQCLRQAEATSSPETKAFLLMMAQAWMKLADRCDQRQPMAIQIGEHALLHCERMQ